MAERRNKHGEVFSETVSRINQQFGSLRDVSTKGWAGHGLAWIFTTSDNEFLDIFARILEDGVQASRPHERRTNRPKLEWDEDAAELRSIISGIVDPSYSTLPFAEAFSILAGDRSQRHLARKVGIERTRVARLLTGSHQPTGDEMEQISTAFGKPRHYFREYRSVMLAAAIMARFDEDPDASAALMRKVAV